MKVKKIKEIMSKDLVTVKRNTTIKEIAHIFLNSGFDFLPVVDDENHLLGVITKEDILTPFIPDYFELLDDIDFISDFGFLEASLTETLGHLLLAEDVMTKNPVTITEEESLFKALAIISRRGVRHLPVIRENRLVGIINRTDILREIFGEE